MQFPGDDPNAVDQVLRARYPEFNLPENEQIETDAVAVLLEKIGPSILLTHSGSGIRGWWTGTKSGNVKAIVAYEPGTYLFAEGEMPPALPRSDGVLVSPGATIPLAAFMKLTEMPVQIIFGDNIPATPHPLTALDGWRLRVIYARQFAAAINRHGGDAEVLVLPEVGVFGNTHFAMSDLNNDVIANLLSDYLKRKGLDRR